MKRKNKTHKGVSSTLPSSLKWSGLQARMTFSYVWVTIACVLLAELLVIFITLLIITFFLYTNSNTYTSRLEQVAQRDALQITRQLSTIAPTKLKLGDPHGYVSSGVISDPGLSIPYITKDSPNNAFTAFELFITPDGNIASSSYPAHYPDKISVRRLIPYAVEITNDALSGKSRKATFYPTPTGFSIISTVPIQNQKHIVGILYIEEPFIGLNVSNTIQPIGLLLLVSGCITLLISAPISGIFGLVTTRGLVHRLRHLVTATTLFADGNYKQRVPVTRKDEVGQLEQQFNRMAEQLVESIAQRQELAEQNARLAERARISRELHDAISQDLFSLSMLAGGLQSALPSDSPLQTQITTLSTTTTNTIREMRALLLELRPLQLENLGLAEGLKELATSYSTRLGITVNTEIAPVQLSSGAEHALLRISQEALANAVRHANATIITLSLATLEQQVTLTIRDNGSGFDPDENKTQHGLGLRLMQERVQELNGTFTLESVLDQGTCITVCLPQEH